MVSLWFISVLSTWSICWVLLLRVWLYVSWTEEQWLSLLRSYFQEILRSCSSTSSEMCVRLSAEDSFSQWLQNINFRRHCENNQNCHKTNTVKGWWKTMCIKCTPITPNKCRSFSRTFSAGAEDSWKVLARHGTSTSIGHGSQEGS